MQFSGRRRAQDELETQKHEFKLVEARLQAVEAASAQVTDLKQRLDASNAVIQQWQAKHASVVAASTSSSQRLMAERQAAVEAVSR